MIEGCEPNLEHLHCNRCKHACGHPFSASCAKFKWKPKNVYYGSGKCPEFSEMESIEDGD